MIFLNLYVVREKYHMYYVLAYFYFVFILQEAVGHFKNFHISFLHVALYVLDVELKKGF